MLRQRLPQNNSRASPSAQCGRPRCPVSSGGPAAAAQAVRKALGLGSTTAVPAEGCRAGICCAQIGSLVAVRLQVVLPPYLSIISAELVFGRRPVLQFMAGLSTTSQVELVSELFPFLVGGPW